MSSNERRGDVPTLAKSAELLRIALAKMGPHADGYYPSSYWVWYEFVAGTTPELKAELERLIEPPRRLTADETEALFDRHIRRSAEKAVVAAQARLVSVLQQMQESIDSTGASSEQFGTVLEAFRTALTGGGAPAAIEAHVATVLSDTVRMRGSMDAFGRELQDSRSEITRLTDELSRLREDVMTDPLTGLANRRALDRLLATLKQDVDGGGPPFSIVMIDIDHFKKINDRYGHLVGDRVIRQVAGAMESVIRGSDHAIRYGGEEFALLLPATTPDGARAVANNIRLAVQSLQVPTLNFGETIDTITVSAGVAQLAPDETTEHCLERADRALYASKTDGRNRVTVASAGLDRSMPPAPRDGAAGAPRH